MTKILRLFAVVGLALVSACCTSRTLQSTSVSRSAPIADAAVTADGAPAKKNQDDPGLMLLQLMMGGIEEKVTVTCPKSGHCVPTYRFDGAVNGASAGKLTKWLKAAEEAKAEAVVIELTTKGGGLDAGYQIVRAFEDLKIPSYCVGDFETMSAGFAILQTCTHRSMTKRTQLLAHGPHVTGMVSGTGKDIKNLADNMFSTERAFAEHCAARLKISFKEYWAKVEGGKDWFMNWEEALKVGAVDQVVPSVKWVGMHLREDMKLSK